MKRSKTKLVKANVKMTVAQRAEIRKRAKRWADGNFSGFVREAALHYTPKKKTTVKVARA